MITLIVGIIAFAAGIACGFLWCARLVPDVLRKHGFSGEEIMRLAK